MPDGCPVIDEEHVNSLEHLGERVALARTAADRAGNELKLSATVMLVVAADTTMRDRARAELAPIASSTPDLLEQEHLRIVDTGDGTLERLRALAALGFDRLHIRPADEPSQRWLDDALPDLQALTAAR